MDAELTVPGGVQLLRLHRAFFFFFWHRPPRRSVPAPVAAHTSSRINKKMERWWLWSARCVRFQVPSSLHLQLRSASSCPRTEAAVPPGWSRPEPPGPLVCAPLFFLSSAPLFASGSFHLESRRGWLLPPTWRKSAEFDVGGGGGAPVSPALPF